MALLVSLMGPSTGLLILSSVYSIGQCRNASELFRQMKSHIPPAFKDGIGLLGYGTYALDHHFYSCAEYVQGSELGSMTSFVVFPSRNLERNESSRVIMFYSQENGVLALILTYSGGK